MEYIYYNNFKRDFDIHLQELPRYEKVAFPRQYQQATTATPKIFPFYRGMRGLVYDIFSLRLQLIAFGRDLIESF